jgi:transcriptional regulator with XRE-family HTH domain
MDVGRRIREVREDLGMPAAVLARRIGVAPNTVWRYESGEREPSMAMLEKIARELRTEPAELLREPAPLDEAPGEVGRAERPEGEGERQSTASVKVIRALRTYFWDMRLRWDEPGNKPKPSQIQDALELLQHLIDKGAFEGSWTPEEQFELQLLFRAARELKPIVKPIAEEMATTEEVEDLALKVDAVFDEIEAQYERIGTP